MIGIAGFGAAAEAAAKALVATGQRMAELRDRLETMLRDVSPDAVVFGAEAERLPNTTMFAVPGVKAETALIALDLAGVAVSSGSACSSGKVAGSPASTDRDIEVFINAWRNLVAGLSKGKRGVAA